MKFNQKANIETQLRNDPTIIENYEGGMSFSLDPKTELYIRAASCLVGENKYYESAQFADNELIRATHRVLKIDPEFVLQLAVYVREKLYLRSVPLVLCAEYANVAPGTVSGAKRYITRAIGRADEITELLSYQFARNQITNRKSKMPIVMKKASADAFNKFDMYQFGKYNRPGVVKLKDALFLTHPKPKDENQQGIFDKLVTGKYDTPITWESMRSSGQMTWSNVINDIFNKNGKINNYMAILKNLRNCMGDDSVTDDDMDLLCSMIQNEHAVKYSKQLPFRFLSAYNSVCNTGSPYTNQIIDALESAVLHSTRNIPHLKGRTLLAADVSGSMLRMPISKKSTIYPYDIGLMLEALAHQFCESSITGFFGDIWKNVPMSKHSGVLSNVNEMRRRQNEVGLSTSGHKVIEYLLDENISVDRIMIFTDCQMWDSKCSWQGDINFAPTFLKYQRINPSVKLYLFDLSGYGSISVPQNTNNVCLIGGWSDRIFDFVDIFENGGSMIDTIKEVTL